MCKVVEENTQESVPTSFLANQSVTSVNLGKNLRPLASIYEDVNRILSPAQRNPPTSGQPMNTEQQSQVESQNAISGTGSPSRHQDDNKPATLVVTEVMVVDIETEHLNERSKLSESDPDQDSNPANTHSELPHDVQASTDPIPPTAENASLPDISVVDVEMEERKDDAITNGSTEKSEPGVIILDD